MMLASLLLFAAARFRLDHGEIPVIHQRASKVLAKMKSMGLEAEDATLKADDIRGVILVEGDADAIRNAQTAVNLFDFPVRRVTIHMEIDSPLDKESFESSATISNQEEWKTFGSEIGISMTARPRLNDDGTTTLFVEFTSKTLKGLNGVIRLPNKKSQLFSIGKYSVQLLGSDGQPLDKSAKISAYDPRVKLTAIQQ